MWCCVFTIIAAWISSHQCLDINLQQGNFSQIMNFSFNSSTRQLLIFQPDHSNDPYKVNAWTTSVDSTVLIVVEQEKNVLSWTIPMVFETTNNQTLYFYNTSRTLCESGDSEKSQNFSVSLATSSDSNVDVNLLVEKAEHFYLKEKQNYSALVSSSQPQYFFYNYSTYKNDTIFITIDSSDDVCLTASIQNNHCPVLDLDEEIGYTGVHQTIKRKGGLRIGKEKFPDGFFLVFVAKADDTPCNVKPGSFSFHVSQNQNNRTSNISFIITEGNDSRDYILATVAVLEILLSIWLFAVITVVLFFHLEQRFTPENNTVPDNNQNEDVENGNAVENNRILDNNDNNQNEDLENDNAVEDNRVSDNNQNEDLENDNAVENYRVPNNNQNEDLENDNAPREMYLADLLQGAERNDRRRRNYLWHILNIALFYSIPVVQLVLTYQKVVNNTGNQDVCYYNFLCANPAGFLSDFNHVYSNIGYILMGILFLGMVAFRHLSVPNRDSGIPPYYWFFYSMGTALIAEGILSGCYHICPTQSNFQYDTSFMYVIAVLCMVKLYQNRHCDLTPSAYSSFTLLGGTIFIAMIGIVYDDVVVPLGSIVIVVYIALCTYISLKIYYFGEVLNGLRQFLRRLEGYQDLTKPYYKVRFIVLVVATIINYGLLITGIVLYFEKDLDFGTFLLILLMGNAVLYCIIYTTMKVFVYSEGLSIQAIIYGILGLVFWAVAAVCFLNQAAENTASPAQSRLANQECIFLDFYDLHDLWHLLSSVALYFTFMFLLCLDDNIKYKSRNDIRVF